MASSPPKLKILMLHGFTNTGAVFHAKTRALEKSIIKAFPSSTLHYLDGPHRLRPSDLPQYGDNPDPRSLEPEEAEIESFAWWRRKDPPPNAPARSTIQYQGIEQSLQHIADTIRSEGPFDGVIGFSQGACAAGVVTSLLEGKKRRDAMEAAHKAESEKMAYPAASFGGDQQSQSGEASLSFVQGPLKFAVIYSGFAAPPGAYSSLYDPKIETPTLHVIGSLDTIVDEGRSRALADLCTGPAIFTHPGGHFCPSTKDALDAVVGFIKAAVLGKDAATVAAAESGGRKAEPPKRGLGEERVEDMDVPF